MLMPFVFMARMHVLMGAVLAGVGMVVDSVSSPMFMGVLVFVHVLVGMDMGMCMGVLARAGMLVFVYMFVRMLVGMLMMVFMVAFHEGLLF
jgi:hypothetical protein